jgi:predicted GH43/DUF377 family glycosyl hydrolase
MRKYSVGEVQLLELRDAEHIKSDQLMSPFVWNGSTEDWMALRVVEPSAKGISTICFAKGNGEVFELANIRILAPGPNQEDLGGCEDPTVFFHEGQCKVYYTGWNSEIHESKLLFASGPSISSLSKRGDVFHDHRHWNMKEATIVKVEDGWRLFFEYSDRVHSLIGVSFSCTPDGDWKPEDDPFGLRPGHWDGWHLSTGPTAFEDSERPVMFYNGSDKDARWRIGWVEFNSDYTRVLSRCDEPLVRPEHLPDSMPDIAFASSAIMRDDGTIELYFSVSDRTLCRTTVHVD